MACPSHPARRPPPHSAWEKRQAEQTAAAAIEAAEGALARVVTCKESESRAEVALRDAVESEGPIKAHAAELENARVAAQEIASKSDLEAKNADAVARKAEQAARVARAAHQGAETKLARELPAKEAADEAAAKADEALENSRAKCEAADQKEADCEVSADLAKQATEAKQSERQVVIAERNAKEAIAADFEAREAAAREAEAFAAKMVTEAEAAEARMYKTGEMLTATSTKVELCDVRGPGLLSAQAGQRTQFTIEARDSNGDRQPNGGDSFFVSIRYSGQGTRVRTQITDFDDGSYVVSYKPMSTGRCTISVSLLGESLPGSPFSCHVREPLPCASQCVATGNALAAAIAGEQEVRACRPDSHRPPALTPSPSAPSLASAALARSTFTSHSRTSWAR